MNDYSAIGDLLLKAYHSQRYQRPQAYGGSKLSGLFPSGQTIE